jgi:hypothetical protein
MSERNRAGTGDADPRVKDVGSSLHTTPQIADQLCGVSREDCTSYVLAELRCAALRGLAACDIDTVGVALRGGMIDAETAVEWLHNCDALDYVAPRPAGD